MSKKKVAPLLLTHMMRVPKIRKVGEILDRKKEKQSNIKAEERRVFLRIRKRCTVALCLEGRETVRD